MVYHSNHPNFIEFQIQSVLNEIAIYDENAYMFWSNNISDEVSDKESLLMEMLYDLSNIKSK